MPDPAAPVVFGPFELDPRGRQLRRGGDGVALGHQAMDLLLAFTRHPGRLLTHAALSETLWPGAEIDEPAVRVHVSALRRALGDGRDGARYIVNEHGRGYRFVGSPAPDAASPRPSRFAPPAPAVSLIGRAALIEAITRALATHPLVTLVGPGGIGKTQAALAAAAAIGPDADLRFVDLSPLADEGAVCDILALALGIGHRDGAPPLPAGSAPVLLVDNCEHLLAAVSSCLARLRKALPALRVLATSREPTRLPGEHVIRLAGLDCPTGAEASSVAAASAAPAVRLFLERAAATAPLFRIDEANVAAISRLCRRLDGIPLTLELAAGWIRLIAVDEIARGLDSRLLALTRGRPTDLARHRSLEAVLDWSYDLLSLDEQETLRRVSVFRGGFGDEAAARVLECADAAQARDRIAPLVEKSLVAQEGPAFRLLEATLAYAWRRQSQHPHAARVQALHARHCADRLATADADLLTRDRDTWTRAYGPLIGDVKAALAWCFSETGDAALGAELAKRSTQIALQSGLAEEFRAHFSAALARADGEAPGPDVAALRFAYAVIRADETGTTAPFRLDADDGAGPEAAAARFSAAYIDGDYPAAARQAEAVVRIGKARDDRGLRLAGLRMLAQTSHHLGRHREAERLAREVLRAPLHFLPLSNVSQHVSMRIILSRIAFLTGRTAEAEALAAEAVAAGRDRNGPSICQALTQAAIPLRVWTGDAEAAAADLRLLRATAHDLKLHFWIVWLEGLEIALETLAAPPERRGQLQFALSLRRLPVKLGDQIATFDPALLTPETAKRVAAGTVGWCAPEALRAEARGAADAGRRRLLLRKAEALAVAQGAIAWRRRIEDDLGAERVEPAGPTPPFRES